MKTHIFYQPNCFTCPALKKATSLFQNSYCTGFPGKKEKRFPKDIPKRKVPNWCPKHISPPECRIYGFVDEDAALMEYTLRRYSSSLNDGFAYTYEHRYKLRCTYPLHMTAKEFYEALQQSDVSTIFPDYEFEFGEIVEIDDGLKPYCFYYAAEKGFVLTLNFRSEKIRCKK